MHSLLNFLDRSAPRWLRFASLTLIHSLVGLTLLLLASLLPLAAWHRLYFRMRGWWLMPLVYGFAATTAAVVLATPSTSRPWMLLVPAGGLALLWIHECQLILKTAPRLVRECIAIDSHEVVKA